jgi:hypothetical protein
VATPHRLRHHAGALWASRAARSIESRVTAHGSAQQGVFEHCANRNIPDVSRLGTPSPGTAYSTFVGTGLNAFNVNPKTGEPGASLSAGRLVATLDAEGNETSFQIVGHVFDLCAKLAG